jgi:hypothetical protein
MKIQFIASIILALAFTAVVSAQDANPAPPAAQAPGQGSGAGGRQGLDWGGRAGGRMAETGMGGHGVTGSVIAVAPSYYTVKTEAGEIYKVNFGVNTRILKQTIRNRGDGGPRGEGAQGSEGGNRQRPAPETIKPTDIKVGDAVAAIGEVDPAAKSVGAVVVLQIDPERAKMMREQEANYGKTWLMGKVTAINETQVSILGSLDKAVHVFAADEDTTFRKHREPVTLADLQVGDIVRVEGAVKSGNFVAASVTVMNMNAARPQAGPHETPPAPNPEPNAPQMN